MKSIELLPKKELKIIKGEPWIWKGNIKTPLENFETGEIVKIIDQRGKFIGVGYINPKSLITVRLLSFEERDIDYNFFEEKIREAFNLRRELYPGEECMRIVYSESDFLPGLIVDIYGSVVVFQITTAGIDLRREWIVKAIDNVLNPKIIVERSDAPVRAKEGLKPVKRVIKGVLKEEIIVNFNGIKFLISPLEGQKTGFFLDQRENYLLLKNISKGKRVLDAFCNNGAFGLHAFKFGAKKVFFLDSSEKALELAKRNLALNEVRENFTLLRADALKELRNLEKKGEKFDIVILDPPAFIKDRKKIKEGMRGYKEINLRAMRILNEEGYLLTCSCSHLLSMDNFLKILEDSAFDSKKILKILKFSSQPMDHPSFLALEEANYLKCALIQVISR
ncbi:MAG: class I SAM-dependent rRNA methyltransferase [Candidatus Aminicenantia bacterium]